MKLRKKPWFNSNGVILKTREEQFTSLESEFKRELSGFVGDSSFRDLYEVAHQAACAAVAGLLREHVNSKPIRKKRK